MPAEQEIHIAQWFHPLLNAEYYPELHRILYESSDLELRRTDNRVGHQYQDIACKLEAARYHAHMVVERVAFGRSILPNMLEDLRNDLGNTLSPLARECSGESHLIEFRDHVIVAHIEALLIQSKSMLDSLTQFYSLAFDRSVKTFSDKGTNLLSDIANLGNSHTASGRALVSLIHTAKSKWINEVIEYRDEIAHFGQLREFRGMHVTLADGLVCEPDGVFGSVLPSRKPTSAFVEALLGEMHTFAGAFLRPCFAERIRRHPPKSNPSGV